MTRFAMNLYRARTSPPTHPPGGGSSCAIFRQSGVRGGGGIGGARVRSVSDSSSRWYTRSVPVPLPCDTRASRVFPQKKKKNSNIIATNRNNTPVAISAQYTNNCFFFLYILCYIILSVLCRI